jgi:hypothetical protein
MDEELFWEQFKLAPNDSMDLTIPYTFYPNALPHTLAWVLFSAAVIGALVTCTVIGKTTKVWIGLVTLIPILIVQLFATMMLSMVITFFTHDF